MLMKWTRPNASSAVADAATDGAAAGGFTPRTLARKQAELKQVQADMKLMAAELRDCEDQLEQIDLEKSRLEQVT